jgi:Kef-type K+ transport system membrane component KefB
MATASATAAERKALKRIASIRTGLLAPIFACVAVILLSRQIRSEPAAIALAGSALVVMLSLVVYISFRLRCPRCSGWIPLPSPSSKCTSCGLSLKAGSG